MGTTFLCSASSLNAVVRRLLNWRPDIETPTKAKKAKREPKKTEADASEDEEGEVSGVILTLGVW